MSQVRQPRAPRTAPAVRREQLVRAALLAFAERGYAGVELQEVAREVGVTRNLIHHYFPGGKAELHVAAVELACEELVALMNADPDTPLEHKMPANIGAYLDEILAPSPRYELYARALRSADGAVRAPAIEVRRRIAAMTALNHLGIADPPEAVRAALIGAIAFTETTGEQWRELEDADRGRLEALIMNVLVATVTAVQSGA